MRTWLNILSWVVCLAVTALSIVGLQICTLAFAMADDNCHDSACSASYHPENAMLVMWIGIPVVSLLIYVVMLVQTLRNRIVLGWALLGLLGNAGVFVGATSALH